MKNIIKKAAIIIILISASICANAYSFSDVLVTGSYGSGSNTAMCIIDFGTKSYAFEYKFDGAKTGADMLMDLNAPNTGLLVDYSMESYGLRVNDLAFNNQAKRDTSGDYPSWVYYTSTDGANWASSWIGCSARTLTDGSWDAWNYTSFDPASYDAIGFPVTPTVPEPSAMISLCSLIGLAASKKFLRFHSK